MDFTRSAAISVLCANQLQAINAMKNIGNMNETVGMAYKTLYNG